MSSATDTEVMAHLIERHMAAGLSLTEATRAALGLVRGAFSIAVVHADEPDTIVAARRSTPLVLGLSHGVALLASDIPALLGHARQLYALADDEIAVLTPGAISVTTLAGTPVQPEELHIAWDLEAARKDGYEDFMSKEMHEQPGAVAATLLDRRGTDGHLTLDEMRLSPDDLRQVDKVCIVACGSSYHAALVAKYAIEHWVKLPTEVDIASEFRYRDPVMTERTLCVGVSQSGETLDTSKAIEEASRLGARVLVVSNVVDSSMARQADGVLYTRAGPEVGVASTKCHLAQIVALEILGLMLAQIRGTLTTEQISTALNEMDRLPELIEQALRRSSAVDDVAGKLIEARDFFFLGRHVGYPMALEGALKLKELAYLRAEGYAAGELKHGPIALIEPGTVVVGIATRNRLWEKLLSNIAEVHSRGATVVLVADDGDEEAAAVADHVLWVPPCSPLFSPVVGVVPLQQLAYRLARLHGHDVDRPRNLAKTVTVE
jgi:glucosamine--fructose-6-phosphate aminotransferase (isomerizing)